MISPFGNEGAFLLPFSVEDGILLDRMPSSTGKNMYKQMVINSILLLYARFIC